MKLEAIMRRIIAAVIALAIIPAARGAESAITIHEWGTFTSLQDEDGKSIGGINSDEEALPPFVHNLQPQWLVGDATAQRFGRLVKDYPRCDPQITIRLETPVLYFHLSAPCWLTKVDAHVEFHGGFLTQFYPDATAGKLENRITDSTVGHLDWNGLKLGENHPGPATTSHVWLAPRHVVAMDVTTPAGESERYLFYRGVGHLDAPLRLSRGKDRIEVHAQLDPSFRAANHLAIPQLWYCDFRGDGHCAFRQLPPVTISSDVQKMLLTLDSEFSDRDFAAPARLEELKAEMRTALLGQGLFGDEADALLNTWELSYFKSAGVRLFYIVPREWTDHYLPLTTTPSFPTTRVMVGRIDLVTPQQRQLLLHISHNVNQPRVDDESLWKIYEQLGRFRNALVLDEQRRRPTPVLQRFIQAHQLAPAGKPNP